MLRTLLAVTLLGLVSSAAYADTVTQSFTVSFNNVNQTAENSNGFLQFNTNLGTLNSVSAGFSGNILFAPSGSNASYTVTYNGFGGGSSQPSLFFSNTMSEMFQTNTPVDPGSVTGSNGFANYFLAFLDLSVTNGTVLAGSTATGTLTYNYTPATTAVTPEPSSLLLLGTGLLGAMGAARRRLS